MSTFIGTFNFVTMIIFTVAYSYHLVYGVIAFARKPKVYEARRNHRYFVLVSGRNESAVIGNLIDSLNAQEYPRCLFDVFVVADNCTDNTAQIARDKGAIVFERFDKVHVGKSWALDYAIKRILNEYSDRQYEAMMVFDADNIVDRRFIAEVNKVFDRGFKVCTSYRNTKNFESSWVSAASSLWFLMESRFLMQPRSCLSSASCLISGTGFMISTKILKKNGGWPYHTMTEDIEFSVNTILAGERVGFTRNAIIYDEQPVTFKQSWDQRLRWAKGFYQIIGNYSGQLLKGFKTIGFACFDCFMTVAPAMIVSMFCVLVNVFFLCISMLDLSLTSEVSRACLQSIIVADAGFYGLFFVFALLTLFAEQPRIHASFASQALCLFTFPIFMVTYLPIAIVALFKKVEWKPIVHTITLTANDFAEEPHA